MEIYFVQTGMKFQQWLKDKTAVKYNPGKKGIWNGGNQKKAE